MNTTEDGSEPVGEAPELVTCPACGRWTPCRHCEPVGVRINVQARAAAAVGELRIIHARSCDCGVCVALGRVPFCVHCQVDWPCDTVRLLDRWGV